MKTKSAMGGVISLWVGLAAMLSPRAEAVAPLVFEVQVEIKAPSGEDLGKRRITTPVDVEAVIEWAQGLATMKLAVLLKKTPEPDCQQVALRLERRAAAEAAKETNVKVVACGDTPVRFEGDELGAPSMTISVRKIAGS